MSTLKPDLTRTWGAGAPGANVVDPDTTTPGKVDAGWEAEIPPFEHINFLYKWFSQALAHLNEQGIAVWDSDTTYPVGGWAKGSDGTVYEALIEQFGNNPVGDTVNWKVGLLSLGNVSKVPLTIVNEAGNRILGADDAGKLISMESAAANSLTVPLDASISFEKGTVIGGVQFGAGQTTIVPAGGVTILNTSGLKTTAAGAQFSLTKHDNADTWLLTGDLEL